MIHDAPHELAGKTVAIASGEFAGREYLIEDWWDRIAGQSWQSCDGNPACLEYGLRSAAEQRPIDDEVVYGKIGRYGHLMHVGDLSGSA